MNRVWFPVLIALSCIQSVWSQSGPAPSPSSASELLAAVRSRIPEAPLAISGRLDVRKHKGIVDRTLNLEIFLNPPGFPSRSARYTLSDAFGSELEQLAVTRTDDGAARFVYRAGSPPTNAPTPDLSAPIQGTDVSWADLTLAFLWWPGGVRAGGETIKGRPCSVVDVSAPPTETGRCAMARLWIDDGATMLIRAESYDVSRTLLRRLEVRNFKRINETWMIKDMEVRSFPSSHRTRFRVEDVRTDVAP